jgi:hypothetical protein
MPLISGIPVQLPAGVPQLPPSVAVPPLILLASELVSSKLWRAAQVPPAWGVFDSNFNQVVFPDSVLEFSNRQEYEIAHFPVQDGNFASYNKVIRPFEITLRLSKAGTMSERAAFLASLADLAASIALYTVITPERGYPDLNLDRYEVTRRGAKGAYFLTEVDCYFVQIIQVSAQYTTTAVQLPDGPPAARPTSNVGNITPLAPTSQQAQQTASAIGSTSAQFYGGS